MMAVKVLALVLAFRACEGVSKVDASLKQGAHALAMESASMEAALMKSMTISKAVNVIRHLKGAPPEFVSLIQDEFAKKRQPGYSGVQKGQDMLNGMIQETQEKLDLERQSCATFIKSQEHQIEVTNQDIRMYDARSAGAREDILSAQTEIERLTELLPKLTSSLDAHKNKCDTDIADLEAQLKIVLGDIDVMSNVLKLTECKEDTTLLQHYVLRKTVRGAKAQRELSGALSHACDELLPLDAPFAFLQVQREPEKTAPPAPEKCTLSKSNCDRLRDKFLKIQSGIGAKKDELQAELASINTHCDDETSNLEAQISDAETDLKGQQTALAAATKKQNDAERNSALKNEEREKLNKELVRMTKLCKVNIQNLESEKCALAKIRGELEHMKGHTNPAFIQDCAVTDWAVGECSATCGGGTQKLTRAISVHPVGGAKCPPLEEIRNCAEEECPVDCAMGDWSEWGDCSADCGGGVKEKVRSVIATPQFGGQPCGETSNAESCNVGACDLPCTLGDWTAWSQCSKMCNGGLRSRVKTVAEPAQGNGECPDHDSDARLDYDSCNSEVCDLGATCESTLDVVLLIDSGSGLKGEGWELMKEATETILGKLQGSDSSVKVSIIAVSGPTSKSKLDLCTGVTTGITPDVKKDCGVNIVQPMTMDIDQAASKVEGLEGGKGTTLTSQGLMVARTELQNGRKSVPSVVIVLAHGEPMNFERTREAAKDLRASSRVMWVAVGSKLPIASVKKWASKPSADNVIQVESMAALSDLETATAIIANTCPKLSFEAAIANGGFEDGCATASFFSPVDVPHWTFWGAGSDSRVCVKSKIETWGGTAAAEGSYFFGLQGDGAAISQGVPHHVAGVKYQLGFSAAGRSGKQNPTLKVIIDGKVSKTQTLGSGPFSQMTVDYTAADTTVDIKFENGSGAGSGDRTVLIDKVKIVRPKAP